MTERRYDIDWIRVMAIGLLLFYHLTISFQSWGIIFQFIVSKDNLEVLWIPMSMLNVWRIPILFFVSGMGVFFAIKRRNWKSLIWERTRRILIPLIFGSIVIVPVHVFIFQKYYHSEVKYSPNVAHLWFLASIFIYVLILSPIFFVFKKNYNGWLFRIFRKFLHLPIGIYVFLIPFILEVMIVKPETFALFLFTKHGIWIGLLAFFFGFFFCAIGKEFWDAVAKLKYVNLILAFILFGIRGIVFRLEGPSLPVSVEAILWIFTVFGFAYSYLNHEGKRVQYLSQAAYPIYIIHMIFQYLSNYLIFPLDINVAYKFAICVIFTFSASLLFYEFVIRRIKFIRPLFGLKFNE